MSQSVNNFITLKITNITCTNMRIFFFLVPVDTLKRPIVTYIDAPTLDCLHNQFLGNK